MNHILIDHQVLKQRLSTFVSIFFGSDKGAVQPTKLHALIRLLKHLLEEEGGLSWPIFISPLSAPQIIQNLAQTRQIRIKILNDDSVKGTSWGGIREKEYHVEPLATIGKIKDQIISSNRQGDSNNNSNIKLTPSQAINQLRGTTKRIPLPRRQIELNHYDSEDVDDDDIEPQFHIESQLDDYDDEEEQNLNDMEVLNESEELKDIGDNSYSDDKIFVNLSEDRIQLSESKSQLVPQKQEISLSYNGIVLKDDETLVSAIQNGFPNSDASIYAWRQIHQFTLHLADKTKEKKEDFISDSPITVVAAKISDHQEASQSIHLNLLWLLDALYHAHDDECHGILKNDVFISSKIESKLVQQIQDPNSICCLSFPYWCKNIIQNYQFLISLDTRMTYFRYISFGLLRSLHHIAPVIQLQGHGRGNDVRHIRIPRQKVRIDRHKLFESSFQVLEICAKQTHFLLDVEYFGEIGVGLGPTKEFYTLLSYQFQLASKAMFLSGEAGNTMDVVNKEILVHNESGLYPKPILKDDSRNRQTLLKNFHFLGSFVAKALMDDRYLDMKFSRVFYKLLLNERMTLYDLKELSPSFGSVIIQFQQLIDQKNSILQDKSKSEVQKKKEVSQLKYEGGSIENLDLTFRIAEGLLKAEGDDCYLSIDNIEEYVKLVYDAFFGSGIQPMIQSFKEGFIKFFPIEHLKCFGPEELDVVICGVSEAKYWLKAELSALPFELANGFNSTSNAILMLVDVLAELSHERQRKFLSFLTGSPRLPIGGFKNLKPLIKISRKESFTNVNTDLPSANTCFNHLKLPNYSEIAIMKEKIIFAIENGTNSFDLS